jgi:hypothetical protein
MVSPEAMAAHMTQRMDMPRLKKSLTLFICMCVGVCVCFGVCVCVCMGEWVGGCR